MFMKYLVTHSWKYPLQSPADVEFFVALGRQHSEALKERVGSGRAASFAIGCLIL